jgi:hypothetical protein
VSLSRVAWLTLYRVDYNKITPDISIWLGSN